MPSSLPRVVLKPRRARPFFARHPWVFVTSMARVDGDPATGDVVEVFSHEGKFIARGLFNAASAIRVRLYRWAPEPLDASCWIEQLDAAIDLRTELLHLGGDRAGYRLVSSEADGLSGLTVDRYDRWLVAQFTSGALFQHREPLLAHLKARTGVEGILTRTERTTAEQEGLEYPFEELLGTLPVEPIEVVEHGLTYWVDVRSGQKTGLFLDQRENRLAVARYCAGKRVLDLYCYAGGFGMVALRHGRATSVLGIDSSAAIVEVARHHATINDLDPSRIAFEAADVGVTLERLRAEGQTFDVVICDPPKFARHPKGIEDALKAYLRLNQAAIGVLAPSGILVTCSCSGLIERELFEDMLAQVSELTQRPIQFLEQRGQASDHPVSASCLETSYLKCYICRVR